MERIISNILILHSSNIEAFHLPHGDHRNYVNGNLAAKRMENGILKKVRRHTTNISVRSFVKAIVDNNVSDTIP